MEEILREEITGLKGQLGSLEAKMDALISIIGMKYLSIAEFSEQLGFAERTILGYLTNGQIQGKKIGTEWRIPMTEVDRLLREAKDNHFSQPVTATRRHNLILKSQNDKPTRPAKRKGL